MGLKLSGHVPTRRAERGDLAGTTVAIDLPNLMYAFYTVARPAESDAARADAVRLAHRGVIARVLDLADQGARCVLVTDGREPHPLKVAHLEEREATRAVPRLQADDYAPTTSACAALGVPIVHAPHDAEAQASQMALAGLVDVVATTDWDALAMGAPTMLRGLSARPENWTVVTWREALKALGLSSRGELATAAVLMGCDYSKGLRGIGLKKAIKLLHDPQLLEEALAQLPDWSKALLAFTDAPHTQITTLEWTSPTKDALHVLERAGFRDTPDLRARLARLDLAQRPSRSSSSPLAPTAPPAATSPPAAPTNTIGQPAQLRRWA